MIGNNLDEQVIGICFNKRAKVSLVEVWLSRDEKAVKIGTQIEAMIDRDLRMRNTAEGRIIFKMSYKRHQDSINVRLGFMQTNSTIKGAHRLASMYPKNVSLSL